MSHVVTKSKKFQSSLPTRGSDAPRHSRGTETCKISILAPHEGERLRPRKPSGAWKIISILAPHEGERRTNMLMGLIMYQISILAPHEGERRC